MVVCQQKIALTEAMIVILIVQTLKNKLLLLIFSQNNHQPRIRQHGVTNSITRQPFDALQDFKRPFSGNHQRRVTATDVGI